MHYTSKTGICNGEPDDDELHIPDMELQINGRKKIVKCQK